jgi:hypothetical protein
MGNDFLFAIAQGEDQEGAIPKADIVAGIRSDDTELGGAIYDIVTTDKLRKRIEPPLTDEELDNLIMEYFERCDCQHLHLRFVRQADQGTPAFPLPFDGRPMATRCTRR